MKKIPLLFTLALITITSVAQTGKISGRILNAKNEAVSGASVDAGGIRGIASDMEGRFVLTLPSGKKYDIQISAVGYEPKLITDVEVTEKQVNEMNVVMEVKSKGLSGVTVTAQKSNSRKETTASLISFQKNTNTVASVISAEAIRRSPDKNTGEVLKRVPGTSIQEGKYLVVRGLNDRYNQAMLNGILLSSTEPDRKTFSFDIFPAPMIDNIVVNKAFVPELPGEWAGGLVQVQTKEIPTADFLTVQVGTGFNSQTLGNDFYQYKGGNLDWLGIADKTRNLPEGLPTKSKLAALNQQQLNEWGKQFRDVWSATAGSAPLNSSLQLSSGFTGNLFGKKAGAVISLTYNQTNKRTPFDNSVIANNDGTLDLYYNNNKYSRDILAGALANFSLQFDNNNRISFKNIINVNSSDFVVDRYDGRDYILGPGKGDKVRAQELGFKQNTFFNTQLVGEHNIVSLETKLKWYGGFNILDQYIPDQRRLFYTQEQNDSTGTFYALLGAGSSQKSGSIFYSFLNDYIYNAGADVSKSFDMFGNKQTIKGGYLFQVKDRLFDSRPFFANTLDNSLRKLAPEQLFAPENFGTTPKIVQFGELTGKPFRYLANTIMNAGYLQFDNQFGSKWRAVWGVRIEDFDQLVGSVKKTDERFVNTRVTDFLPGVNITYKPTANTNIRVTGSQTVARPEFRELSPFAFYDFELNAQVVGKSTAKRSKISNFDVRYEIYPRAGELITIGAFYKFFKDPIEYYFNRTGPATNTFNINNTKEAKVYGAELEFRKKLDVISSGFKNFTLSGNVSYIYSRVKDTVAIDRPLQGQSPYLLNVGLQYDVENRGFTATVLFNQIGRRILFVGNEAVPNIWENPRPLLDVQVAQKFFHKKAEVRINISDIFNKRAYFYHDLDGNKKYNADTKDVLAISRNYGTNYSITFGYTIK